MPSISVLQDNGQQIHVNLDKWPDTCPVCTSGISVVQKFSSIFQLSDHSHRLESVFVCPKFSCGEIFISKYKTNDSSAHGATFTLEYSYPKKVEIRSFSSYIESLSGTFVEVYNQSIAAENHQLKSISGAGYRKALEFLVKDYLCKIHPEKEENIKKMQLGKCIQDHMKDEKLKQISRRAAWLGNDEVHYLRKWENKDLDDLKELINMTIFWLDHEHTYQQLLKDMPEPSLASGESS